VVVSGAPRSPGRGRLAILAAVAGVLLASGVAALVWPRPDEAPPIEPEPAEPAPEEPREEPMPADSLAVPEPEPEPEPEPPGPEEGDVTPPDEEATPDDVPAPEAGRPRLPPADPWASRPPPVHASFRGMLRRGRVPSDRQLRSLRTYQRSNRDDPRTHLVYAYVYMQRGWYSAAVRQYRNAYRLDTSVRGDARMKSDLIRLVALEGTHADAVPLVMEIYEPDEIRAELELMISRTGDDAEAARLGVLRALLER
jgi:hypothetical protein